jgi:hypothetical protein
MNSRQLSDRLVRHEIPTAELKVGDMREIGRDFISRVRSIRPYWTDEDYVVVDNVCPPAAKTDTVIVWREALNGGEANG